MRIIYKSTDTDGIRIAECRWQPSEGSDDGRWLDPWISDSQRRATSADTVVIVTFVDVCGKWRPWTIACESACLPGEMGLFAAAPLDGGQLIGYMRDGAHLGVFSERSRQYQEAVLQRIVESKPSYLYTLKATRNRVSLHDGRTSRPGGPRNANDARGLGVPQNAMFYDNGALHVKPFVTIPRLFPTMRTTQRRRAEILCEPTPSRAMHCPTILCLCI